MKQKYDWQKLKALYFASQTVEVADFLKDYLGTDKALKSGNFKRQTTRWREEKQKFIRKAIDEAVSELNEEYKLEYTNLLKLKKKLFDLIYLYLRNGWQKVPDPENPGKYKEIVTLSTNDIKTMLELIKIELGEPISISKSSAPLYEDLTGVMEEFMAQREEEIKNNKTSS